jgi:hypothetical protein
MTVLSDLPDVMTADFSLVRGGPLFQLWLGTRLTGSNLERIRRRIFVMVMLTWLPLLLLALIEGHALPGSARLPFLLDIEQHLRLLVALPLLIFGELLVHRRIWLIVQEFLSLGLVPNGARAQFDAAVASAVRLRNSGVAEFVLVALVYGVGVAYFWRNYVAIDVLAWYGTMIEGKLHPSLAGWWMGCVSLPVLQFLLLRWYFRLVIWARFLWQVSRIKLQLVPTHPDGCAGLGFLNLAQGAFAPMVAAQGVLVAGVIADRIFFGGAHLSDFYIDIVAILLIAVAAVLAPLLVFSGQLNQVENDGVRDYGALAQRYVRDFDQKWLRRTAGVQESLLGSADIQSLADLSSSFERVQGIRSTPFTIRDALQLGVLVLLPILPLLLTMFSFQDLIKRAFELMF